MKKNNYGVFEIILDKRLLKHMDKVKLYLKTESDSYCYRNLAYSQYTIQNPTTNVFDSVFWNPENPYLFKYESPKNIENLKIYEAHIGMSSSDEKVSTYEEFRKNI